MGKVSGGPVGAPLLTRVFQNISVTRPTAVGFIPGTHRMFVLEQDGRVLSFENDPDVRESQVMLDIRRRIGQGGANERGLLNLAFDKDFEQNRFFYVYYTGGQGSLSNFPAFIDRYQVNAQPRLLRDGPRARGIATPPRPPADTMPERRTFPTPPPGIALWIQATRTSGSFAGTSIPPSF